MLRPLGSGACNLGVTADVTTKQLATKGEPADLLCCGERAPAKLLQSWLRVCCGPVQLKPAPNGFRRLLDPPV